MPHILTALPAPELLISAALALFVAYAIFGITGFGSALIAAPVLAQFMPISMVVPLLAILDLAAAITNGFRLDAKASLRELMLLYPALAAGTMIGAAFLFYAPTRSLMFALGVFIIAYAIWSFFAPQSTSRIARGWAIPIGTIGGIFSGLFGMGGAIYSMYISRRFDDRDTIRATQSALIGLSTVTRLTIFVFAGSYNNWEIPLLALLLVPIMFLGILAGHHLTLKMSRERFLHFLYLLLIASGIALIIRAFILRAN
ncbi:MAG TPA: sulfite exporter TauE/SafE family protein [Xanthobacteraceae bacterium]|jgi:uncharacterized membrane protein YfcA|nr:sulfite exporter TauE/SafE family protein [Xanthobacteraceae bacterium]